MIKKKVDRADFFRNGFGLFLDEVKSSVKKDVQKNMHPPGALEYKVFKKTCTSCEKCVKACPHDALFMFSADDESEKRLPIISPDMNPCHMCQDFPCIEACSDKALLIENQKKIGIAFIKENTCYAHKGQICDYCFDRCPEKNKAITMKDRLPVINNDNCTGCGICVYFCPEPNKGIKINIKNEVEQT